MVPLLIPVLLALGGTWFFLSSPKKSSRQGVLPANKGGSERTGDPRRSPDPRGEVDELPNFVTTEVAQYDLGLRVEYGSDLPELMLIDIEDTMMWDAQARPDITFQLVPTTPHLPWDAISITTVRPSTDSPNGLDSVTHTVALSNFDETYANARATVALWG